MIPLSGVSKMISRLYVSGSRVCVRVCACVCVRVVMCECACAECVRATGAPLSVLHHTCGECRRGGITSRAAAVRLAPRTIATLFMAKRRFNKYAHRQYLQSRRRDDDDSV